MSTVSFLFFYECLLPYYDVHLPNSNPLPLMTHYITPSLQWADFAVIATKAAQRIITMTSLQLLLVTHWPSIYTVVSVTRTRDSGGMCSQLIKVCTLCLCSSLVQYVREPVTAWGQLHSAPTSQLNKESPLLGMRLRAVSRRWRDSGGLCTRSGPLLS